jgi:hypothetical protein
MGVMVATSTESISGKDRAWSTWMSSMYHPFGLAARIGFGVSAVPISIDVNRNRRRIALPANWTSEKRGRTQVPGLKFCPGVLAGRQAAPEQPWSPGPSLAYPMSFTLKVLR